MHQRLPTFTPATSQGEANGEPATPVRIVSSTGSSKPSSANRARSALAVFNWPIVGYLAVDMTSLNTPAAWQQPGCYYGLSRFVDASSIIRTLHRHDQPRRHRIPLREAHLAGDQ